MDRRSYFVYILTNCQKSVLYIGVTNDLERRLYEHRMKVVPGFSEKYQTIKLVYYEATEDVMSAIAREKQLKRWSRGKKEWLIGIKNLHWNDLLDGF